ncbi:uncharacterized protein LOC108740178 isoform X2 [Agrilus planipennis]|uniref:Uncharacterized protein LOC108740178 isoform X2 n=1 Tax=Agrilus planipennis TaxID=224129 RepID=A0A1W4XC25_AGRPL|nr:uncharacterized protein LOC108740178 isoform X2 [Agrilus planipennis]
MSKLFSFGFRGCSKRRFFDSLFSKRHIVTKNIFRGLKERTVLPYSDEPNWPIIVLCGFIVYFIMADIYPYYLRQRDRNIGFAG